MKKKIALLLAAVTVLTLTTGCRKNKNTPTEEPAQPTGAATEASETTVEETVMETMEETTLPTIELVPGEPTPNGEAPPETTQPKETILPAATEPVPVETMRPSTGENSQDISGPTPLD